MSFSWTDQLRTISFGIGLLALLAFPVAHNNLKATSIVEELAGATAGTEIPFQGTVIVFDVGKVLLDINGKKLTRTISKALLGSAWFVSAFRHRKDNEGKRIALGGGKRMRAAYYEALHQISCQDPRWHTLQHITYDDEGKVLPRLLQHWQVGTFTWQELFSIIDEHLLTRNTVSVRAAAAIAKAMIHPTNFNTSIEPCQEMIKFLQTISQEKDINGARKYRICLFSNWAKESWQELQQKDPYGIFNHVDVAVCSAFVGATKPAVDSYQALITQAATHNIDMHKSRVIFIDDRPENRDGGKNHGWICFDPSELSTIKRLLACNQ